MELEGRTAIVTGASRGLGRHIARALAPEKANLVLAARTSSEMEQTAADISGVNVKIVATDVARRGDLQKLAAAAGEVDEQGNNAGIEIPSEFQRLPLEDMDRMLPGN